MRKVLAALAATLSVAGVMAGPALAEGPNAVRADAGCTANALSRNDDGSTGGIPVGFVINFFGTATNQVFVNNNGNVTIGSPMSDYTPFGLAGTIGRRVIAPFFADVDTRGSGSDIVRYSYGGTMIDGHPAFCVNWVNVGYYAGHFEKLNSFQLVLIDRSDIGAGDFDMEFNYDKIQWETGDASGGSNGFGGTPAAVGFTAGTGVPGTYFDMPGSRSSGDFLDSNAVTGLVHNSRNSLQLGRYVFPVRNGLAPAGGRIQGVVSDGAGNPLSGAPVQVCPAGGGICAFVTTTNSSGGYDASGLPPNSYNVTAFAPPGASFSSETEGPLSVAVGSSLTQDLVLHGPTPPPAGVSVNGAAPGTIPRVVVGLAFPISVTGCSGGAATYEITGNYGGSAAGALVEGPPGTYTAMAVVPFTGPAHVVIAIAGCPTIQFDIYIDPSGYVRTPGGNAIEGATVTLYRSDSPLGPFVAVADGSAIMSPANRSNPDLTDASGHFGWDTIAGFYRVRAAKADCHAPGNPAQEYVETGVLPVPPPVLDIDLRLEGPGCPDDLLAPVSSAAASSAANAAGWHGSDLSVLLSALDNPGGSGVASITYSASGAEEIAETTVDGDSASVAIDAEGVTTVTFYARDEAGNVEEAQTFVVRLDKTAPAVRCSLGTNPSGGNKPNANAGFRKLEATDAAAGIVSLVIADSNGSFVSSELANGANVKLTQSKGSAGEEPGEGAVAAHIKTKGPAILRVTDAAGNVGEASCA